MLDYILAARPLHEQLRDALIQIAGFALMRATAPARLIADISPAERAAEAIRAPIDGVAALRVPPGAAHHHYHLTGAGTALQRAVAAALNGGGGRGDDALHDPVEAAERHLRAASRLLPGFEIVDLSQGCCAAHSAAAVQAAAAVPAAMRSQI